MGRAKSKRILLFLGGASCTYMTYVNLKPKSKKAELFRVLPFQNVVGIAGFEPAISCPPDKRLTGLGHIPNSQFLIATKQFYLGAV